MARIATTKLITTIIEMFGLLWIDCGQRAGYPFDVTVKLAASLEIFNAAASYLPSRCQVEFRDRQHAQSEHRASMRCWYRS